MITPEELREAERGIKPMLARKFSATWIATNMEDLLGQANIEYMDWLKDNPPASNPVGWLLNCARWRALNLRDSETRKPRTASLDSVIHLADTSAPTPEQQILTRDSLARVHQALSYLPDKERKLLTLVYFEGYSVREAGESDWQKSAADRHHAAALKKMHALTRERPDE